MCSFYPSHELICTPTRKLAPTVKDSGDLRLRILSISQLFSSRCPNMPGEGQSGNCSKALPYPPHPAKPGSANSRIFQDAGVNGLSISICPSLGGMVDPPPLYQTFCHSPTQILPLFIVSHRDVSWSQQRWKGCLHVLITRSGFNDKRTR